jgi:hypothetical protein
MSVVSPLSLATWSSVCSCALPLSAMFSPHQFLDGGANACYMLRHLGFKFARQDQSLGGHFFTQISALCGSGKGRRTRSITPLQTSHCFFTESGEAARAAERAAPLSARIKRRREAPRDRRRARRCTPTPHRFRCNAGQCRAKRLQMHYTAAEISTASVQDRIDGK